MLEFLSWLAILWGGLVVTLELTAATAVLTVLLSAAVAIGGVHPWKLVRIVARGYADLFRSIPLLALLTFVYFGLGSFTAHLGLPALWLAVFALTLSESAYLSENYRAGLQAIPSTQWEDAKSLGLKWRQTVILIVLPQAIPPAIPTTLNAAIGIIKDSSLASIIAVSEVTLIATQLVSATFLPLQVYLTLGLMYLALIIPLTVLSSRVERAFRGTSASRGTVPLEPVTPGGAH